MGIVLVHFGFQSEMWIERVLLWYSLDGLTRNSAAELE